MSICLCLLVLVVNKPLLGPYLIVTAPESMTPKLLHWRIGFCYCSITICRWISLWLLYPLNSAFFSAVDLSNFFPESVFGSVARRICWFTRPLQIGPGIGSM